MKAKRRKTMRKLWGFLTVLTVVLPFLAYGQSSSYYDRSYIRMSYVQGDVFVQRAQDQGYEKGELNLVVVAGDKLGSRAGRLEIQLGRRNYLRLDNDTQVDLVNLPSRDGDPTKLHVLDGSVFLRIQTLDREKNIEVHTPDASFYILTAGAYRVDVRENRETEFSVLSGSAEAAGEEGSVAIDEGQRISAAGGRFTSETGSLLARRDDFGSWNENRDGLYARGTSGQSYLPAEYADYESELADNGSWVNESEYGNVWVPRGIGSDWRPYSYGRWVWYPIIGYTWVSSDPWGWCTHHYGRWGWGASLGWYWIPRNHWGWGPAWVNWWNDGDYYGWCPLSYWDYPCVIYNNHFYGRYHHGDYYNYNHFARSMTMVDRNRLWDRNIGRSALGRDRLLGRVDRISLADRQPDFRRGTDRGEGFSSRASAVLGRDNLRSISRGYDAGSKRLNASELRSSVGRVRSGDGSSASTSKIIREGTGSADKTGRQIRNYSSASGRTGESHLRALPSTRKSGETGSSSLYRKSFSDGSSASGARRIREFSGNSRSTPSSSSSPRPTIGRTRDGSNSSMKSYPSRIADSSNRGINSARNSSSLREYDGRSANSARSYSAPSRSYSSPSRSYSAPSRDSGSYSRSYSAPSRSYSAPSRSYSSPSRSYSAPSRDSGSYSRSYSAPSRSYSAPSRSYSSPSRSSSNSGSSRGSSSSSRSSGGSAHRR
jgi:hypothetical protein